jgi:SAM-dependent methyltransferase
MPRGEHRTTYTEIPEGRDGHMVRVIGGWLQSVVRRALRDTDAPARVIDIGCGEQPLRKLVEAEGGTYVGFDVEQNAQASVAIIGFIDRALPLPWPDAHHVYDVVLCTEVLEHVADWDVAFMNLRSLVAPSGRVIMTVPFIFPLHMEPFDYFRATPHVIEKLAGRHHFVIDEQHKLGNARDVIATALDDVSILPNQSALVPRIVARVLRTGRKWLVSVIQSDAVWTLVSVNSNTYLSNAVVLRPLDPVSGERV